MRQKPKPKSKPKITAPSRGGRPQKEISQEAFENLCEIQCTEEEICAVLGVTDKTLTTWCRRMYDGKCFSEIFKIKRRPGLASLRRKQYEMAQSNPTMAIWLGKNWLGQKDKSEETSITKVTLDMSKFSTEEIKKMLDTDVQAKKDG